MNKTRTISLLTAALCLFSVFAVSCVSNGRSSVMKLGGFDVSRDLYAFAVRAERDSMKAEYGDDVFDGEVDEKTVSELRNGVVAYLRNMFAVLSLAKDHGIAATDPTIENDVYERRVNDENEAGGRSEFLAAIAEAGMTEEVYRFLTEVSVISDELYYAMINSGEIDTDPAFVRSVIEGDECVRVRQILVKRENRTDELAKELAGEAQRLAAAGEDFDALISRYNEDMRMFSNSQGYYLMRGVWHRAFEDAAFALGVGEVSGVVETPSGYSVLKRYEKDPEYINDHFDDLCEDYYDSVFSLAREKRAEELEMTDSGPYEKLDILKIAAGK